MIDLRIEPQIDRRVRALRSNWVDQQAAVQTYNNINRVSWATARDGSACAGEQQQQLSCACARSSAFHRPYATSVPESGRYVRRCGENGAWRRRKARSLSTILLSLRSQLVWPCQKIGKNAIVHFSEPSLQAGEQWDALWDAFWDLGMQSYVFDKRQQSRNTRVVANRLSAICGQPCRARFECSKS